LHAQSQAGLLRAMGRWTLAALMINSIIGSGIFGLPSLAAGLLGSAAPWGYVIAAAGVGVIMACFAEAASRFSEAGGPYLYTRAAFGRFLGIEVGWLLWLSRASAPAAGANLFVIYLAEFWPRANQPLPRLLLLTLLVGGLAAINYRGVQAGAQLSNVFTVAKLVPLAVFIVAGGLYVWWGRGAPAAAIAPHTPNGNDWLQAMLLLMFAYGGFEGALMPMAEARQPRRDAPFALLVALLACTAIYVLVQIVVMGTLADPAASDRPLALAARQFLGAPGAWLISLGALVSVYGYLSANMLAVPRLTFALAERGDFPAIFAAVHPRFRTPHISLLAFAGLVWLLALSGGFGWNVTLSVVARLFVFGTVCAAVPVLRRKGPGEAQVRLPAGMVWSALGVAFSLALVTRMGRGELGIVAGTMLVALGNWWWARRRGDGREAAL